MSYLREFAALIVSSVLTSMASAAPRLLEEPSPYATVAEDPDCKGRVILDRLTLFALDYLTRTGRWDSEQFALEYNDMVREDSHSTPPLLHDRKFEKFIPESTEMRELWSTYYNSSHRPATAHKALVALVDKIGQRISRCVSNETFLMPVLGTIDLERYSFKDLTAPMRIDLQRLESLAEAGTPVGLEFRPLGAKWGSNSALRLRDITMRRLSGSTWGLHELANTPIAKPEHLENRVFRTMFLELTIPRECRSRPVPGPGCGASAVRPALTTTVAQLRRVVVSDESGTIFYSVTLAEPKKLY